MVVLKRSTFMNLLVATLIGLTAGAVAGCAGPTPAKVVEVRSLSRGGFSGIQEARQEVVRDSQAWTNIWSQHRGKSSAPCPPVDFSKEMVVVVTMGRQNSGGFAVRVMGAETTRDAMRIRVSRTSPQKGNRAIQVLTAPYEFVAVPRNDLRVEFVDTTAAAGR